MYRLMLKTCLSTGMNYLCVTKRSDYDAYKGSGTYWRRHLKVHGDKIRTRVLYESETKDAEFIKQCKKFSCEYDVVANTNFANLIYENGNTSWIKKDHMPEDARQKIRVTHLKRLNDKVSGPKARKAISVGLKRAYLNNSDLHKRHSDSLYKAYDSNTEKGVSLRKKLSNSQKRRFNLMPIEEKLLYSERVSKSRLSLDANKRKQRADKVSLAFKTSEARKKYEERMKVERKGCGNPSAFVLMIDGNVLFGKGLDKYCKEHNTTKKLLFDELTGITDPANHIIKGHPYKVHTLKNPLICKHCGFTAYQIEGFARWHGDNCRSKK